MLNEEKIRYMAKASMFTEEEKQKSLYINRFFRGDFVVLGMIKVGVSVTAGFLIVMLMWVLYKAESLLSANSYEVLINCAVWWLIGYILVLSSYLLISFFVYHNRYLKMQKTVKEYQVYLKRLSKMNEDEVNIKKRKEDF